MKSDKHWKTSNIFHHNILPLQWIPVIFLSPFFISEIASAHFIPIMPVGASHDDSMPYVSRLHVYAIIGLDWGWTSGLCWLMFYRTGDPKDLRPPLIAWIVNV